MHAQAKLYTVLKLYRALTTVMVRIKLNVVRIHPLNLPVLNCAHSFKISPLNTINLCTQIGSLVIVTFDVKPKGFQSTVKRKQIGLTVQLLLERKASLLYNK